jgi:hypothetical protein
VTALVGMPAPDAGQASDLAEPVVEYVAVHGVPFSWQNTRFDFLIAKYSPGHSSSGIDHSGGHFGGRLALAEAVWGQSLLSEASLVAGQSFYGGYRNARVVHGKEKVYGSIP